MRTRRWTRSPKGQLLGVATGFAEWRGFPVNTTRLIFLILAICTEIFPALIAYLILAVVLPLQSESDWIRDGEENVKYADAEFKEYDDLKKKSENVENDFFDKEKDWENRFKDGK